MCSAPAWRAEHKIEKGSRLGFALLGLEIIRPTPFFHGRNTKNTPLSGTFTVPGRGLSLFASQNPPKPKKPGSWPL